MWNNFLELFWKWGGDVQTPWLTSSEMGKQTALDLGLFFVFKYYSNNNKVH